MLRANGRFLPVKASRASAPTRAAQRRVARDCPPCALAGRLPACRSSYCSAPRKIPIRGKADRMRVCAPDVAADRPSACGSSTSLQMRKAT